MNKYMPRISFLLMLALLLSLSSAFSESLDKKAPHKKSHSHRKEITMPVRNGEWYLNQARESGQFKSFARESGQEDFLNRKMSDDQLLKQATVSNRRADANNQEVRDSVKKNSSLANPNEITFLFIPPIPNNKLIDLPSRLDSHPTFMLLWKE
jgi:hypothetical protein